MRRARRNDHIVFKGARIMLFQDLSQITLKNRRALRLLLDKLTWRFTFSLVVTLTGKQHILRSPTDLPEFCEGLGIELIDLPEWYQEFTLPPSTRSPPTSSASTPEKQQPKHLKQGRGNNHN